MGEAGLKKNCFRPLGPQFGPKIRPFPWIGTGYKICICSVISEDFKYFLNYKGFSTIFPKILDAIYGFTNVRIFLTPISITFLNPKILGFLFLRKTSLLGE